MIISECLLCEGKYESKRGDKLFFTPGQIVGVCPTCRENAVMGARARGMEPMVLSKTHPFDAKAQGFDECLEKIKEGK